MEQDKFIEMKIIARYTGQDIDAIEDKVMKAFGCEGLDACNNDDCVMVVLSRGVYTEDGVEWHKEGCESGS